MDKYELLRNVNFDDIGEFCLNGRNTTGKIVKVEDQVKTAADGVLTLKNF